MAHFFLKIFLLNQQLNYWEIKKGLSKQNCLWVQWVYCVYIDLLLWMNHQKEDSQNKVWFWTKALSLSFASCRISVNIWSCYFARTTKKPTSALTPFMAPVVVVQSTRSCLWPWVLCIRVYCIHRHSPGLTSDSSEFHKFHESCVSVILVLLVLPSIALRHSILLLCRNLQKEDSQNKTSYSWLVLLWL